MIYDDDDHHHDEEEDDYDNNYDEDDSDKINIMMMIGFDVRMVTRMIMIKVGVPVKNIQAFNAHE
jgi:hypothetical protein